MESQIIKELKEALEKTLSELEYTLHNQDPVWMYDHDRRQAIIDENSVVKQARKALKNATK